MRHIFTCLTAKLPLLQAKHMQVLPPLTDPLPSWASTWVYVLDHQNPSYLAMPSIRFGPITATVGERKSMNSQCGALGNGSGQNPGGWQMWWKPSTDPTSVHHSASPPRDWLLQTYHDPGISLQLFCPFTFNPFLCFVFTYHFVLCVYPFHFYRGGNIKANQAMNEKGIWATSLCRN